MNKLQTLEKQFSKEFPSKGAQYNHPNHDFTEIQLDGWYTADELRNIAQRMDDYNNEASQ